MFSSRWFQVAVLLVVCSRLTISTDAKTENLNLILREVSAVPAADECPAGHTCCFYMSSSSRVDCYGGQKSSDISSLIASLPGNQYVRVFLHSIEFSIIPDSIFGSKAFSEISIHCSSPVASFQVTSTSAFASSQAAVKFELSNCNSTATSFQFLSNFQQLKQLVLYQTQVQKLRDLPQLPNLQLISITGPQFREWHTAALTPRLRTIQIVNNLEENVLNILQDLTWYTDLENLNLANSSLETIPDHLKSFSRLRQLYLGDNLFTSILNNSIPFNPALESVGLHRCPVETIQAGAFDGIDGKTSLALWKSRLDTLDPDVFLTPLAKMSSSKGVFSMNGVRLNCSTLYWLLCENRQYLPLIRSATCAEPPYVSLSQHSFNKLCPDVTTSTTSKPSSSTTLTFNRYFKAIALISVLMLN